MRGEILPVLSSHVETVLMLFQKPDSVINVKVEFGEGKGKVPLDNIAKRAEAYQDMGVNIMAKKTEIVMNEYIDILEKI